MRSALSALRPGLGVIGLGFIMVLAACGGGDGDDAAALASLADVANAGAGDGEDASSVLGGDEPAEVDAETAFLGYAECMRGEGIDFPDPTFNADGRIERGANQADRSQDGFDAADERCRVELDGVALGGRGGDFQATIQDGLLLFTECIREQGIAVDDLDPTAGPAGGAPGAGTGAPGGGAPGGGVQRDEGQRSARLASALGLDVDDPVVADALATCEPTLTGAFDDARDGAVDG